MKNNILIPIYHLRDFLFYRELIKKIKTSNFFFLFFFDFNKKHCGNYKVINFFDYTLKQKKTKKISKKLFLHEHLSFKKSLPFLQKKFSIYYSKNLEIMTEYKINLILHELGGFVCHLSIFESAKSLNIPHYFIEPTPLKKNCFFLKNSMAQEDAIIFNNHLKTKKKVNEYLQSIKNKKYLAINSKDLHLKNHNMLNQILSAKTLLTLIRKITNILLFKRTEFNNLKIHMHDYIQRTKNSLLNIFFKKINLNEIEDFIYYPLHVPLDFALTHRAQSKINQIDNLHKICPENYNLILKEHPLIFSKYHYQKVKDKLKNLDVNFFDKNLSTLEISERAKCALTINSKSGLEFLCKNKPVFSLIKNYYTKSGLAVLIKNKTHFYNCLRNINKYFPIKNKLSNLLNDIFKRAIFFDLYNLEKTNINRSANSLKILIKINKLLCKKF